MYHPAYGAVLNTIAYLVETTPVTTQMVDINWPVEDVELLCKFEQTIEEINADGSGRRVRLVIIDTVISMPGMRMPFEKLCGICKKHGILSMVDGAHGAGMIPLDLHGFDPDFFTTNLYKFVVPSPSLSQLRGLVDTD